MAAINGPLCFATEMFFQDSSDEDDEETNNLNKIWVFAEETVPNFTDQQFQSHFRKTPTTFESLFSRLRLIDHRRIAGNPEISLEKQLMLTVWYLANIKSFRCVADRFGISRSTAWKCFYKICKKLLLLNNRFKIIAFPSIAKCSTIMNVFRNKTGFPGVVGAINGSHITIIAPKTNHISYVNRKGYHSILLQAVCDDKKMFIDCYAGEAGSVHDACLFRRSQISHTLVLPPEGHLLGDCAYSLTTKLLVPFKDNGHLTEIQKCYNKKHSQTRVIIENAFALLKGRFRRLKLLEAVRPDHLPLIIICACILHNVCLALEDLPLNVNLEQEFDEERIMNPRNPFAPDVQNNMAVDKRNNIANAIYYENLQLL